MAWEKDSEGREYKKKKSGITKYRSKKDARDAIGAHRSINDENRQGGEDNNQLRRIDDKNERHYNRKYKDNDETSGRRGSLHYVEQKEESEGLGSGNKNERRRDVAKFSSSKDAEKYKRKRENGGNADGFIKRKEKNDKARKLSCGGSVKRSKGGLLKRGFNLSI